METLKLQNFSIFPENCEILTRFYPPHKIAGNIVSFCPRHKSRKFLQVFVPQKYTPRIVTGGDVPTRYNSCTRIVTGDVSP